ncbi:MAG: hypothetical protein ACKVU0_04965 [Saprospiraceae bacterium]
MKIRFPALLLFSAIIASCATSKIDKAAANRSVQNLKEHGLVVWLPDSKHRIEFFKSKGWHKDAAEEQAKAQKQNRELVKFYKEHFDFCKVFFYYTSLEEDLKNNLPVLLNADMRPDPSIPLPKKVIIGGFYFKEGQESHPFPTRHFRVEDSSIKMDLISESPRPFWAKKGTRKVDIIRLNNKLKKIASSS